MAMKKADVVVGGIYVARVSGALTRVRVDAIREREGWGGIDYYNGRSKTRNSTVYDVTSLRTGRRTTFRSAAKLRYRVGTPVGQAETLTAGDDSTTTKSAGAKPLRAGNADVPVAEAVAPARPTPLDAAVALLTKHGANAPSWADWPELVVAAGADPADLTPEVLERAGKRVLRALKGAVAADAKTATAAEVKPDEISWDPESVAGEWPSAAWHRWASRCGRYRVTRVVPSHRGANGLPDYFGAEVKTASGWDSTEWDKKLGRGYPKHYRVLSTALEAAAEHLRATSGAEQVRANAQEVLDRAILLGLSTLPEVAAAASAEGKERKAPTSKTTEVAKTPESVKAPRRERGPVPEGATGLFGSRPGSNQSKIAAALAHQPQTMRQLMDTAGVGRTYYDFLNPLADAGLVKRDGKTFSLVDEVNAAATDE